MVYNGCDISRLYTHPLELECKRFKKDDQFESMNLSDTSDEEERFVAIACCYF